LNQIFQPPDVPHFESVANQSLIFIFEKIIMQNIELKYITQYPVFGIFVEKMKFF